MIKDKPTGLETFQAPGEQTRNNLYKVVTTHVASTHKKNKCVKKNKTQEVWTLN